MQLVTRTMTVTCAVLALIVVKKLFQKYNRRRTARKKSRKKWQAKWLQKRDAGQGTLNMLREELLTEDPEMYKNFLRMDNTHFEELLSLIRDDIAKTDTHLRQCVSTDKRLAVTLRYLASGNSYRDLMFATRIHESTISLIVPEVCQAIVNRGMSLYLQMPQTRVEWEEIAREYKMLWNFPQCVGALDGKHINFQAPRSAGSYYYNYKGHHSIVLLGLVDAKYKFLYVDVGINGRNSDGRVFYESSLRKALETDVLHFPQDTYLPGTTVKAPYCIVADDAFPLSNRIMKPFPCRGLTVQKRIFNYRLSRARRVVENAFGILANRFRILLGTINLNPDKVELITLTCCILHNYLTTHSPKYTEEKEECPLPGLSQQGGSRCSRNALSIRELFCTYFNSPAGRVPWQNRAIGLV